MVIAASAPEDEHQTHKKMEKLAVGMNMAGSGFSMIVSNLTIGVIKDTMDSVQHILAVHHWVNLGWALCHSFAINGDVMIWGFLKW